MDAPSITYRPTIEPRLTPKGAVACSCVVELPWAFPQPAVPLYARVDCAECGGRGFLSLLTLAPSE